MASQDRLPFATQPPWGQHWNDKTIVEVYINSDMNPDFQIELTGIKTLSSASFMLAL